MLKHNSILTSVMRVGMLKGIYGGLNPHVLRAHPLPDFIVKRLRRIQYPTWQDRVTGDDICKKSHQWATSWCEWSIGSRCTEAGKGSEQTVCSTVEQFREFKSKCSDLKGFYQLCTGWCWCLRCSGPGSEGEGPPMEKLETIWGTSQASMLNLLTRIKV